MTSALWPTLLVELVGASRLAVEFRRVAYNVTAAAEAVRASGLPAHFAEVLETGGVVKSLVIH